MDLTMKPHKRLALELAQDADDGRWRRHSDYHWSLEIPGDQYPIRIDYWPTADKVRVDDMSGDVCTQTGAMALLIGMGQLRPTEQVQRFIEWKS